MHVMHKLCMHVDDANVEIFVFKTMWMDKLDTKKVEQHLYEIWYAHVPYLQTHVVLFDTSVNLRLDLMRDLDSLARHNVLLHVAIMRGRWHLEKPS